MKNIFLETGNVARFREALSALEDTERGQPGLGVVWGRAGRGKTVCARKYAVDTQAVYLRVLEDWSPRAMLAALCHELNGTEPSTVDRCKKMAVAVIEDLWSKRKILRTILVDEADRLKVGLIEHLRDVHDLTGAPVILIGEENLSAKVAAHRRISSRVVQTVEFGPITREDIILFGLEAAGLRMEPDAAARLQARSSGDFRLVWADVHRLEQMARAAGSNRVEARMVDSLNGSRKQGARSEKRLPGGHNGA
jgi:DNA transposition AAA+ family ATPase